VTRTDSILIGIVSVLLLLSFYKSRAKTKAELLIFVTPKVMRVSQR